MSFAFLAPGQAAGVVALVSFQVRLMCNYRYAVSASFPGEFVDVADGFSFQQLSPKSSNEVMSKSL